MAEYVFGKRRFRLGKTERYAAGAMVIPQVQPCGRVVVEVYEALDFHRSRHPIGSRVQVTFTRNHDVLLQVFEPSNGERLRACS